MPGVPQLASPLARRALDEFEVAGLPTVLPFHRKVVRDPAFTADDGVFGVFTRWIETEFTNDIPPWDGELSDPTPAEARHTVVVEVAQGAHDNSNYSAVLRAFLDAA